MTAKPTYQTIPLSKTEAALARLALEKKYAAEQAAAREFAEAVAEIAVAHNVAPRSHVDFGIEKSGGPIVMRVTAPPREPAAPAPAPESVRRGRSGKRARV